MAMDRCKPIRIGAILAIGTAFAFGLLACSYSAGSIQNRASASDCRARVLQVLREAEYSDRANSTSWSGEGSNGLNQYYAEHAVEVQKLIVRLDQDKRISRIEFSEALDTDATKWDGFSYNPAPPASCDSAYLPDDPLARTIAEYEERENLTK